MNCSYDIESLNTFDNEFCDSLMIEKKIVVWQMLTQLFDQKKWIVKSFCRQRKNSIWVNEKFFFKQRVYFSQRCFYNNCYDMIKAV